MYVSLGTTLLVNSSCVCCQVEETDGVLARAAWRFLSWLDVTNLTSLCASLKNLDFDKLRMRKWTQLFNVHDLERSTNYAKSVIENESG